MVMRWNDTYTNSSHYIDSTLHKAVIKRIVVFRFYHMKCWVRRRRLSYNSMQDRSKLIHNLHFLYENEYFPPK